MFAGTLATFAGVVWTAEVAGHMPACEMPGPDGEDLDPLCLGAVGEALVEITPPVLLLTSGVTLLAVGAVSMYLHHDDPEPRQRRRAGRENLRSRWYKLPDDPSRAPGPR